MENCVNSVKFDPTLIRAIRPEFITKPLIDEISQTLYLDYGEDGFYEFAGYDIQEVRYLGYYTFKKYYEEQCKKYNVSPSKEILNYAKEKLTKTFCMKFEKYMAENKTMKHIGVDYP